MAGLGSGAHVCRFSDADLGRVGSSTWLPRRGNVLGSNGGGNRRLMVCVERAEATVFVLCRPVNELLTVEGIESVSFALCPRAGGGAGGVFFTQSLASVVVNGLFARLGFGT